jgi:cellulose synthase/poly-beta-1,6-N-acetylglucosamine synthase-like glycosyltransferase
VFEDRSFVIYMIKWTLLYLWLFAGAVAALLYPYVVFPALLAVISRKQNRVYTPPAGDALPRVAILASAFNEESRIAEKIRNFLALDYPEDRIGMWIGTDGSADDTAGVVRRMAAPRVHLVERRERAGKTAVLNVLTALARARGAEIFVFTDINNFYRPDTVRRLAAALQEADVGLVCGRTLVRGADRQIEVEGAYYRLEQWLKERESSRGWLAGALGAVYAMRAELYTELHPALINDLTHPCQVAIRGYKSRFDPMAISEEAAGDNPVREFSRQTRMTAQGAFVLATQMPALLAAGCAGQFWVLLSHKLMRWIAGLWLIVIAVLLPLISLPLTLLAALCVGVLFIGWKRKAGWATFPVYFFLVHLAYLNGLWRALLGERYVVWKPREA